MQTVVETYRYLKGNQIYNDKVKELVNRDFIANMRLVLNDINFSYDTEKISIDEIFVQEDEYGGLSKLVGFIKKKLNTAKPTV